MSNERKSGDHVEYYQGRMVNKKRTKAGKMPKAAERVTPSEAAQAAATKKRLRSRDAGEYTIGGSGQWVGNPERASAGKKHESPREDDDLFVPADNPDDSTDGGDDGGDDGSDDGDKKDE